MTLFYVDAARPDDSGNGLTAVAAKKTVAAGLALMTTAGDVVEVAAGTYTQASALVVPVAGSATARCVVRGAAAGAAPLITCATNSVNLFHCSVINVDFTHLSLSHTAATRGKGVYPPSANADGLRFSDVTFDGFSIAIDGSYTVGFAFGQLTLDGVEIRNSTDSGVVNGNSQSVTASRCTFRDNAAKGVSLVGPSGVGTFSRCIFARNGTGVYCAGSSSIQARHCVFQGHTLTGTNYGGVSVATAQFVFELNVVYGNAGYGVNVAGQGLTLAVNRNNAYGGNAAADRLALAAGTADVALSGDPFVNATGNDFSLNNVAGAGAACRGLAVAIAGGATTGYPDAGAAQSSGGGATYFAS